MLKKSDNYHYVTFHIWNVIAISRGYRVNHPQGVLSENRETLLRKVLSGKIYILQ